MCGGKTGPIAGGQIPQLVEHLPGDTGGPGSNPSLDCCIFFLSDTFGSVDQLLEPTGEITCQGKEPGLMSSRCEDI